MQTQEAPVQEAVLAQPETTRRNWSRWLIAAAVVVGLIAVGLVMWAFDDDASDPQLETVTELVDTMHEGFNERDEEKFTSVFTDDAVWVWENPTPVDIAFRGAPESWTWKQVTEVTQLGSLEESGHEVYTFVHQMDDEIIGRAVVVIDFDGELISRAEWVSGPIDYEAPAD